MRWARALTAVVLARPGAPTTSRWPSANRAINRQSISRGWPMMCCCRSSRRRENACCRCPGVGIWGMSIRESCTAWWALRPQRDGKVWSCFPQSKRGSTLAAPSVFRERLGLLQAVAEDAWGHEDQQFRLVVDALSAAEQEADPGDITQPRHLRQVVGLADLIDAAQHHCLAVIHQYRCIERARIDHRHLAAARHGDVVVQRILVHVDRQEHAVVG